MSERGEEGERKREEKRVKILEMENEKHEDARRVWNVERKLS